MSRRCSVQTFSHLYLICAVVRGVHNHALFFAAFPCVGLSPRYKGFGNHCEGCVPLSPGAGGVPSAVEIGRLLGREILGRGEHIGGVRGTTGPKSKSSRMEPG